MIRIIFLFLMLVSFSVGTKAFADKPIALVYNGPGACLTCWTSAAQNARLAGFKVKLVNSGLRDYGVFNQAKLWVQPGGNSRSASKAMGSKMLSAIRNFVSSGGGYVGFCAGAFLSTERVGTTNLEGLGITPGRTELWDKSDGPGKMINIAWEGDIRSIYYHGGPFIDLTGVNDPSLRVISHYDDGSNNGLIVNYGSGRVAVTGAHPEASKIWKVMKLVRDRDGSDQPLVVRMMKWAVKDSDGIL